MRDDNPDVQETDAQSGRRDVPNEVDLTIPVPDDAVKRARERRAAFARRNPEAEPGELMNWIVDEIEIRFDPDLAPGGQVQDTVGMQA